MRTGIVRFSFICVNPGCLIMQMQAVKFAKINVTHGSYLVGYHPASYLAEAEGFEPPEPDGSADFKTASFDHSDKPPRDI